MAGNGRLSSVLLLSALSVFSVGVVLPAEEHPVMSVTLTDASDEDLVKLNQHPQLCRLYVKGGKVIDAGLEHLKNLTQLKFLSVVGTTVTEDGRNGLHELLPSVRIRW